MDYRKLISFGKNSYVVSLPKSWVKQHKLVKGDLIYVDENEDTLVLKPRLKEEQEEDKEIVIQVNGKSSNQIQRELIPAYITNNKTIIFSGTEIKDKAAEIEPLIQNLIALEIVEQASNKIVAKDFLNMNDISVDNLIRKMDMIVKSMFEDSINMFKEDTYENINHRDRDVNRLSYLIFRAVNYSLHNQSYAMKHFKSGYQSLLTYYLTVMHLEAAADEVRRIARYMKAIKLNKEKQKIFIDIFKKAQKSYLDTIKAIYTNNISLAYSVADTKRGLIEECENFYLENREIVWVAYLVDRLKRLVSTIHRLTRVVN